MNLSRVIPVFGGVAALALFACSAFSGSDDPSPGGADGGAADAPKEGEPRDAATADAPTADAAGTNLLLNGNFELPCAAGWRTSSANVFEETTTTPNGGARSCRVCGTNLDVSFSLDQEVVPFVRGKTYVGEVFVRAPTPADDASVATGIKPGFFIQDITNNVNLDTQFSAETALTDKWQRVGALIHADVDGGAHLVFLVQALNGCFLIDDARVYQMP